MSLDHRHGYPHEHELEPQYGLPEALPADERLLWQGSPNWASLARHTFHVKKLAVYFGVIIAVRVVTVLSDGAGTQAALASGPLGLRRPIASCLFEDKRRRSTPT